MSARTHSTTGTLKPNPDASVDRPIGNADETPRSVPVDASPDVPAGPIAYSNKDFDFELPTGCTLDFEQSEYFSMSCAGFEIFFQMPIPTSEYYYKIFEHAVKLKIAFFKGRYRFVSSKKLKLRSRPAVQVRWVQDLTFLQPTLQTWMPVPNPDGDGGRLGVLALVPWKDTPVTPAFEKNYAQVLRSLEIKF